MAKQFRTDAPPSEWCQELLESGCSTTSGVQCLSSLEKRHVRSSGTTRELHSFAPTARELVHRAHEMRSSLASDAAWDPEKLLGLPQDVIEDVTRALERRGCRGLGLAEAMCLPFVLYSTDTVHILRLSGAMRALRRMGTSCTAKKIQDELGPYAGVVCALVESGAILRRYITPERLLPVLSMQSTKFLSKRKLVFRGVWLPPRFNVDELCRCYSFTSWSLWPRGALSVLEVYRGRVAADSSTPVLCVALRDDIMRLALPTTALYFAASPDGKATGNRDRPRECLPKSRLRPVHNDAGVAQGEKEIVLPPFCHLEHIQALGVVRLADLKRSETARKAAKGFGLGSEGAKAIGRELESAVYDATSGGKALRKFDADKCLVVFINQVDGSWFESQDW